ncbi:MAG: formylglycine-generating enzyme family protein [Aggregatilineales bacterium]
MTSGGSHKPIVWWFAIALLAAACSPAATPAPPTVTPAPAQTVTANADWTPVVRVFDGVQMAQVPAGCFTMGHNAGRRDERPEHRVCVETFWIDVYEVTNAQFGSQGNFPGDNRPRENLTWFEARNHCAARDGRLPTEAEWEYAARGPDSLLYPWGNELVADNLVFDQNANNQTADVGSKPGGVSWVGAYDMSGNVFEWVSTIYRPYPYNPTDGRENLDDATSPRVYRSGWGSYIDFGVSAPIRFYDKPDSRNWFLGFRCARDADAQ